MNDRELPVATAEPPLDASSPRSGRKSTRGQSRIEFERLSQFFHVPINEAAKGLGVCATVLKKVCRKHGIPRWPHRKIKKIDTMLAMLEISASKSSSDPRHEEEVRKKMEVLMQERTKLMTEGKALEVERKAVGEGGSHSSTPKKRKREEEEEVITAPVVTAAVVPTMLHEFTMLNKALPLGYPDDLSKYPSPPSSLLTDLHSKHLRFPSDDSLLSPVMFSLATSGSSTPSHVYQHYHHHDVIFHHHPEQAEGQIRLLGVDIPMQE